MSFCCFYVFLDIFLNQIGCEARPCCKEIEVDCLDLGLGNWVPHRLGEDRDDVLLFFELVDVVYFWDFY